MDRVVELRRVAGRIGLKMQLDGVMKGVPPMQTSV